jgi:hypothetical protein
LQHFRTPICTCCTPFLTIPSTSDRFIQRRQYVADFVLLNQNCLLPRPIGCVVLLAQGYCSISSTPICTCCTPFLTTPST